MKHRVGIVGLGVWPREAYLPLLAERDDVEIVAVAARSEATRRVARETLGAGPRVVDDYRQVLEDDAVDAIMVALPNRMHLAALEAAVKTDKHLFIEPPLGNDPDEVAQALQLLEGFERVVHVDLELRYLPVVETVGALLRKKVLGEIRSAEVCLCANWGYGGGGYDPTIAEDGFFSFLGAWYLDLLDVVFSEAPTAARVIGGRAMNGLLMDHGWASLAYPGDRIGQFAFSIVDVEELAINMTVQGAAGKLEADLMSGICRWRGETTPWQQHEVPASQPAHGFVGMRESLAAFFAAVAEDKSSPTGLGVAGRVHQAVAMCARQEMLNPSGTAENLQ